MDTGQYNYSKFSEAGLKSEGRTASPRNAPIMPPAPLPADEERRLASVHRLQILDTPAEERFDRLSRIARRLFKVPYSMITLIDEKRQWFKSATGPDFREIPRQNAICGYTLLQDSTLVIPDCSADPRVMDYPMVRALAGMRFYAGVPLHSNDGYAVGTLCVLDQQLRTMEPEDIAALEDLAACAESEMQLLHISRSEIEMRGEMDQLRRKASVDALTKTWNRGAIMEILAKEQERARKSNEPLGVALMDIDHFKKVNDTYGHDVGDQVLQEFTARIRSGLRGGEAFGRFGGEEFLIVVPRCNPGQSAAYAETILEAIRSEPIKTARGELPVTASMGIAIWRAPLEHADALIKRADKALYQSKRNGRDRASLAV